MLFSSTALALTTLLTSSVHASPLTKRKSDQVVSGALSVGNIDNYAGSSIAYNFYQGDGSTGAGWPGHTDWVSFNSMFTINIPMMLQSCTKYNADKPTTQEIRDLYSSIQKVSLATKVDHRFILAIIMQETGGCPRAASSKSPSGVANPGLMQDHDGTNSCNSDGKIQSPCPSGTIEAMITDGTAGTTNGDGLAGIINQLAGLYGDVSIFYKSARYYNAGFLDKSGDLGAPGATRCYASDVANRLLGWTDSMPSKCTLNG